jgi:hypothetical protein
MMTLDRHRSPLPAACALASELALAAYDGEPSRVDVAGLFAHTAYCTRCRRALRLEARFITMLRGRLRRAPGTGAPAALHARVRARLRAGAGAPGDARA